MKSSNLLVLVNVFAALIIAACGDSIIVDPISAFHSGDSTRISEYIDNLPEDFQTSRVALFTSQYESKVDDYPVTVIVFSELDAYLVEQQLDSQTFLENSKLNDFVASTMLIEGNLYFDIEISNPTNSVFQTYAGKQFEVSSKLSIAEQLADGQVIDGFEFYVGDQQVVCRLHKHYSRADINLEHAATLCRTTRPFVEFAW